MIKNYFSVVFFFSFCVILNAQIKIKSDTSSDERKSFLAYEEPSEFQSFEITKCGTKKCEGTIIDTFENSSTIKSKINYSKGLPNGEYQLFHSNGNRKVKGFAYKGIKSGPWEYYYENSNLKILAMFNPSLKNHPTKWVEYFPNGSIKYFIELDNSFQLLHEFELNLTGDTIFQLYPTSNKDYPYYCRIKLRMGKELRRGGLWLKIISSSLEGIDVFFKGSATRKERPLYKNRSKSIE